MAMDNDDALARKTDGASVGDGIDAGNARWTFTGNVAKTFDSHVRRSVPLYDEGHDIVMELSHFFLEDGSICYELGSSTGELTYKLGCANRDKDARLIGIDSVDAMTKEAAHKCKDLPHTQFVTDDINTFDFQPADMIIAYYTIQFIRPKFRQMLINRIYEALNWGGAFVWFEKVRAPDARFQDIASALYVEHKLKNSFGSDEIIAKSRSLKGVLEPFSTDGNYGLLNRAGFNDAMTIFKYVCFEGLLAIK